MWVGFISIKISVLGAKTLWNPETPGINPDTPEISEIPDILDLSPDIPVLQNCGRRVVSGSGACIRFRLVSKL